MSTIKLTDLLNLPEEKLSKLKLVFNSDWDYDPNNTLDEFKPWLGDKPRRFELLKMYSQGEADLVRESVKTHNPNGRKRYINGDYVLSFIPFGDKDWLLVNAYKVLDDSRVFVEADESAFPEVAGYIGKLVITWEDRKTMNIVMCNPEAISHLTVKTILEQPYDEAETEFPGYENLSLSWSELKYVLNLKTWQTALKNQKGVYLITDVATNKRYVGSAYGDTMLLGRWQSYAENGHGGNRELKSLVETQGLDYVKNNFRYSILDIHKATTDDKTILDRESWWKEVLLTRNPKFGYNAN